MKGELNRNMSEKAESNEIHLIRTYEAPLEAVWDAWVDPLQASEWWGPRGFTLTTHSKDFKVGGTWHYTMHGPDKADYINKTRYLEIEPHKKMTYDHGGNDERKPLFRVNVNFCEKDSKTSMAMRMTFPTSEEAKRSRGFIKKAGGDATWDRLAEYLEKRRFAKEVFVINRSFEAPKDVLFDFWVHPQQLAQWLAPTGFKMECAHVDVRPGGKIAYKMSNAGMAMYGQATYRTIKRPSLLVYTQQFCDEKGNVSRHPKTPLWPETMLTTVSFTSENEGRTRVTVVWEAHGPTTREEMDVFIQSRAGMTLGWTGSFDKLEALLPERA